MSKPKLEKRFMEMRAADGGDDQSMIIEGRAICYNSPQTYTYGDYSYTEVIQPGALDKTDMKDVPLRYNHNDSFLIMARTRNRSLELIKDEKGLMIRAELLDTQSNRDVYQAIKEGLLDKMSFAFTSRADTDLWEQQGDDTKRTITDIEKLYDVSIVDVPFYDDTSIYARSFEKLESWKESLLDEQKAFEVRKRKLELIAKLTERI